MKGISWSDKNKYWRMRFQGFNKTSKNLESLTNKMRNLLSAKNRCRLAEIGGIGSINYKNKNIIVKMSMQHRPYFAIFKCGFSR